MTQSGFGPDLAEVFGPAQADGGPELVQLLTPEGERVEHPDFSFGSEMAHWLFWQKNTTGAL